MTWILFYKRLLTIGGAEVLLGQHYQWLKQHGQDVKVISFEVADLECLSIDLEDLIVLSKEKLLSQVISLTRLFKKFENAHIICHSGYIEAGLAAQISGKQYSIFVHQPTTMSFNEQDKFASRFWPRYQKFAKHDLMYKRLCEQRLSLTFKQRFYIELRSHISQEILRKAEVLFVLSEYAVREKRAIFNLEAVHLSGAIDLKKVTELFYKGGIRPTGGRIELVSISRLDENKRVEILIKAVAALKARGQYVRLQIGGQGPTRLELETLVADLNLVENVKFIGFVPDDSINALYREMDMFVTIDWADFRITTYEVLAENRRVIVSSDTDSDPNLEASGYLFSSDPSPALLADCIERALKSEVLWNRNKLAEHLKLYTWSNYFTRVHASIVKRDA